MEKGFDFYAPQTFVDENDERIMFAWAGSGEMDYPSDENGWAHCLTVPRKLRVQGEKLYQKPIPALTKLRKQEQKNTLTLSNQPTSIEGFREAVEGIFHFHESPSEDVYVDIQFNKDDVFRLKYDVKKHVVSIDRGQFTHTFGEQFGVTRNGTLASGELKKVDLFFDHSILEVFINDGELAFTSRIFPTKQQLDIQVYGPEKTRISYELYELSKAIEK
ncbi:sucrose-6-phosphate hydrolase SacC (GH32 family) [Texcoconibacillus texcoconensis]|uniref:Sucrose-6-phosphate hydrolase SacC (GH32 family) n=1 Tax=Texcoconibacillus texcoconensis TaxID=1095777 RepID=A0A840QRS5_9BACI|nr:sucrose-6-phosphate hydrolase SacC (GH32 family) [Texcoconibacillus texcoconensis]